MKQEEYDALSAKAQELHQEVQEKGGSMFCTIGDLDNGRLTVMSAGKMSDIIMQLAACAKEKEEAKYALEKAIETLDKLNGEYAKRKKKAKVLWIATAIIFAVLAVIEVATVLAIGDVSKVISAVLLNICLWVLCFVATKAQLRV